MGNRMVGGAPRPDLLTTCSVCGREVARTARTCPNCGVALRVATIELAALGLGILLLIALIAAIGFGTPQTLGMGWFQFMASIAWPAVVLVAVGFLTLTRAGRGLARAAASRFQRVSAFGVEVDLTADTASDVKATFQEVLSNYRDQIKSEFDHQVRALNIDTLVSSMVQAEIYGLLPENNPRNVKKDFRCTIHVQDVLLANTFYQLLDYYPQGGGRGRTFSVRYGIIGRSWRINEPQREGNIPVYVPGKPSDLINKWGMTLSEAIVAGQGRQSFLAILITKDGHTPVGMFYCDSSIKDAFDDMFQTKVTDAIKHVGLPAALDALGTKMRGMGPNITALD